MSLQRIFAAFLISITLLFVSCRKDELSTKQNIQLTFSVDTIFFDTLFTGFNSSTKAIKVYNPENQTISIDRIELAGGTPSPFRINVDGQQGVLHANIELAPEDSMYIFLENTMTILDQANPFILQDSIIFEVNSSDHQQDLDIIAWGQDANYYSSANGNNIIQNDTTWTNNKPHVIFGQLWVDSAATLTIEEGCQIHIHNDGIFGIYKEGQVIANGTTENPIAFQGSRLEFEYEEIAGQWRGIYLHRLSYNNVFNNVIIKNAQIGIQIDQLPSELESGSIFNHGADYNLYLYNSHIRNMSAIGLWGIAGAVQSHNSIFSNCGQHLATLSWGGAYQFRHCTFANYWIANFKETPAVIINDFHPYVTVDHNSLDSSLFANCVITGNENIELVHSFEDNTNLDISYLNVIAKVDTSFEQLDLNTYSQFIGEISNENNLFIDKSEDYHLEEGSELIGAGDINLNTGISSLINDKDGNTRVSPVSIGALEFIE